MMVYLADLVTEIGLSISTSLYGLVETLGLEEILKAL